MVLLFKKKLILSAVVVVIIVAGLAYLTAFKNQKIDRVHAADQQVVLPNHEKIRLIHTGNPEKGLIIYIADQTDSRTANYAKKFSELSYYVALIDNQSLLHSQPNPKTGCLNIAGKINGIVSQLQSRLGLDDDDLPILVGSDKSSATVYAALAQSEGHTFHAAVGINLAQELNTQSPLCKQQTFLTTENQPLKLIPVKRLPTSFYVFQEPVSSTNTDGRSFTDSIGNIKMTFVEGQQQTAAAEAIQILQWLDPRLSDQISSDTSDSDLPTIEVPVGEKSVDEKQSRQQITHSPESLAVLLTGDGGWAEIDKSVANLMAEKGIPTIALDSLSYFWKSRTPQETAKDVESLIVQYLERWNKKKIILIGYSFGADVLPFVANNFSPEVQQKISVIALLGMGKTAAFEFRLSSWMNADKNPDRLPILPEIAKMKWANSVCIYGVDDEAANCLPTADLGVNIISMPGDHHFDKKYDELVQHIIENAK